ncbi:tetratricopeptide (TPR) repeat protein [Neobacillus sp. B4I6]|uniref:tetratricopeptide repeat protein n=1 Tax=Neobacillus sp. B4I6 TaxID=3373925 RepID=UPI003D1E773D
MVRMNYDRYPLEKLEFLQEQWEIRDESEDDPDFRQEWVSDGIEIHKALVRKKLPDEKKSSYYHSLARLYLEYGRSEKMIQGNDRIAFRYLQMAASYMPDKGDTFYHLAFLAEKMTQGNEKWESAAFYAKEALERGLTDEKKIKIWCLLGKAYLELGLTKNAEECYSNSKKLDQDDEFTRFRLKYSKKADQPSSFSRLNDSGVRVSKRAERESWIEKSRYGKCFFLENGRYGMVLHGNGCSMVLNATQGELLKLLFETKYGITKREILINLNSIKEKNAESIKTDIRRLRLAIQKGLDVEVNDLIQTVGEVRNKRYILNPEVETYSM